MFKVNEHLANIWRYFFSVGVDDSSLLVVGNPTERLELFEILLEE